MKLLLDTCTFLWVIGGDASLSARARDAFTNPENDLYLSAVSAWEVTLKHSLGALPLPKPPHEFLPAQRAAHGVESLTLDEDATYYLARLPKLHKDPFDRMLVCQALAGSMTILTPDEQITRYPVRTLW